MTAPRPSLPRGPFVLLGLMTTTTILGPFLIGGMLRGGDQPNWPPDRPVEWATVLGTSGAVLALMTACLALLWFNRRVTVPRLADPHHLGSAATPPPAEVER